MKKAENPPIIGQVNQGYTITDVFISQDTTAAIGHSETAPSPWVCWSWDWERGFHSGRYYSKEDSATLRMAQLITMQDITTIAAAEGAVVAAMDKLGINWVEDVLAMIDHDLTTPAKLAQLEQLVEGWRIP